MKSTKTSAQEFFISLFLPKVAPSLAPVQPRGTEDEYVINDTNCPGTASGRISSSSSARISPPGYNAAATEHLIQGELGILCQWAKGEERRDEERYQEHERLRMDAEDHRPQEEHIRALAFEQKIDHPRDILEFSRGIEGLNRTRNSSSKEWIGDACCETSVNRYSFRGPTMNAGRLSCVLDLQTHAKSLVCFAICLMLLGCHSSMYRKPMQPENFYAFGASSGNRVGTRDNESPATSAYGGQATVFKSALEASRNTPTDVLLSSHFGEQGIVLVNMLCYGYFRQATEARQQARYRDGLTTNVSTVIGALLNLDGASNYATGAVTAIAGGLSNDYKSQDTSFLPAPDLSTVQKLVARAMDAQADEMRALQKPTYSQISVRLIRIAETCDFSGIRALVQQSTTEGAKNIKTDGSGNAMVSNTALPETQFERAKARQAMGFEFLKKCEWKDAEMAFREADTVYPRFQASYEFWNALRNNPDNKKKAAVLSLPTDEGGAYLPNEVRTELVNGTCGS